MINSMIYILDLPNSHRILHKQNTGIGTRCVPPGGSQVLSTAPAVHGGRFLQGVIENWSPCSSLRWCWWPTSGHPHPSVLALPAAPVCCACAFSFSALAGCFLPLHGRWFSGHARSCGRCRCHPAAPPRGACWLARPHGRGSFWHRCGRCSRATPVVRWRLPSSLPAWPGCSSCGPALA